MPLPGKVDRFCGFDHKSRLLEMFDVALYDYDEGTGQYMRWWQKLVPKMCPRFSFVFAVVSCVALPASHARTYNRRPRLFGPMLHMLRYLARASTSAECIITTAIVVVIVIITSTP